MKTIILALPDGHFRALGPTIIVQAIESLWPREQRVTL